MMYLWLPKALSLLWVHERYFSQSIKYPCSNPQPLLVSPAQDERGGKSCSSNSAEI